MNLNNLITSVNSNAQCVKDALLIGNQPKAEEYLQKVTDEISTIVSLPDCNEKVTKELESLQAEIISLFEPKLGLKNNGQNCWANAMIQMLRNSSLSTITLESSLVDSQLFRTQLNKMEPVREENKAISKNANVPIDAAEGLEILFNKMNFTHQLEQTTICGEIFSTTYREEPLFGLEMSLNFPVFSEMYQNATHFVTNHSKTGVKQTTSLTLQPNHLDIFIRAKRFNGFSKIATDIENIPNRLPNHLKKYELAGCIIHKGGLNDGHYVSLIKRDGVWTYMNDETVFEWKNGGWQLLEGKMEKKPKGSPEKLLKKGYIFHYKKSDSEPTEKSDDEASLTLCEKVFHFFFRFFSK